MPGDEGFKRFDGFVGSIPQKFIDRNLPRCPMCGSPEPAWTIKTKLSFSLKSMNRNLFRCEACHCVLSAEVAETAGFNRTPLTTTGLIKRMSGKKNSITYLTIEEVGSAQVTELYKGREMPMEELQALADAF